MPPSRTAISSILIRSFPSVSDSSFRVVRSFISPEVLADEMYAIQLRSDKIVFSSETASYLHDLTDRDPLVFTVTVPRGYGTGRLRDSGISVVTVMPDKFGISVTKGKTIHKREISVYDLERTICDIIKARGKMEGFLV